jgi:hypothetical protein
MKKFLFLITCILFSKFSFSQNIMKFKGSYDLYKSDNSSVLEGKMFITPFEGNKFVVRGEGWVGIGMLNETKGYYDWRFDDGKTGQTTFTLTADGVINGRVVGYSDNPAKDGLDWSYKAKKAN